MSAQIPSTMPLSDLLKSTGYDCPEELQGKTFEEATAGGDVSVEANKTATIDVSSYTEPVTITPTEGKDAMAKATVTLSNIPSPDVDLESDHATTIDVSTYTEPAVIHPTEGKDGMEQVTVTLANIPSGGSATAYAWKVGNNYAYYDFDKAPTDLTAFETHKSIGIGENMSIDVYSLAGEVESYAKIDDSSFTADGVTMVRDSSKDFTLWS